MIGIIDYGLGNVLAFSNIYHRLGIPAQVVSNASDLRQAEKLILPGVGSFDWAMARLNESGMREALDEQVLENKIPVIGICVGFQMMANRSEEGESQGLGWLDAEVLRFPGQTSSGDTIQLPHMGWNDLELKQDMPLFQGLESPPRFYFLHSYFFQASSPDLVMAEADYHGTFAASASRENVYGVQFHPEKSHHWGVGLLENFARYC